MPSVSIIIPTRNRCDMLPRAIESARQSGRDVEIVVVDDRSDDSTPAVCGQTSGIRYLRSRNRLGPAGARNVGIIASTSEYVSFLDDDDLRLPGSIDTQLAMLSARPDAGLIYGRTLYGDEECHPSGGFYPEQCPQGDVFWQLLLWNFIPCPSVIFRRDCLFRVGLLDEQAKGIEDWDLWIRIAELYPVLALDQAVAVWRRPTPQSNQFTSRPEAMHRQISRLHKNKWENLPRVLAASENRRHDLLQGFAERAAQQLLWEAASRLKKREDLRGFFRIVSTVTRLYPLRAARKLLRASRPWANKQGFLRHETVE